MSIQAQPCRPRPAALQPGRPGRRGADGTRVTVDGFSARLHTRLAPLAPLWRGFEAAGAATAYQTLDWVRGVIDGLSAAEGAVPLLIEVVDEARGETVMIVPLALVRHRGYREITWLDLGVCDYAAPVLAPGIDLRDTEMRAAWRAIRRVLPAADLIRISRIPADIQGRPNPFAMLASCRPMAMAASGVAIAGEAATLLERLCRPSTRKDMAKLRRRLDRAGPVAFVQVCDAAQVDTIFDALVAQRRERFAEMGRFDLLSRPEIQALYRDGAHRGLAGGPGRLFGLSVGGEWIAAAFGLVHGRTFHGILLTMAGGPWRNTSPGLHIVADTMRWARTQELDYFDFTVGTMPYKADFGVSTRPLVELVQAKSPTGVLVDGAVRLARCAKTNLHRYPALYDALQSGRRRLRRTWG